MIDPTLPFIPTGLLVGQSPRTIERTRVRLWSASLAGGAAGAGFLALYYSTLGLLPSTYLNLKDYHPVEWWHDRLDLSQFFGTILDPPYATRLTWLIGFAILVGLFIGTGVLFAILHAWAMAQPNWRMATVLAGGLFIGIAAPVSLGSGYDPAVMRQALPDTGFLLMGWSILATLQLIACSAVYTTLWCIAYRVMDDSQSS